MTVQRIQSIEVSDEFPVRTMYAQSIAGFEDVHKQLSALPADPNDPLPHAKSMLRDMGVDVDNDYGDLILGVAGKMGMDALLSGIGIAATGPLGMGLDMASGILMGVAMERQSHAPSIDKPEDKRDAAAKNRRHATSMFRNARPLASRQEAPKQAATTMMRQAQERKKRLALRRSAHKRLALRKQMAQHMENIRELQAFISCGVDYARRVTVPNGSTGEKESYLVASTARPELALRKNGKQERRPDNAPTLEPQTVTAVFAAPRMAMGM